ncbi:MAG: protein-export membrane protein SecF [Chloroflexota bacterium]|nr:protein translocase subunit SecF [Chloroflexota bacterium]NOG64276.1 protein translocase subunit SecF [Chloroflexota bacterium]GIK65882.1 MAG: protein-export membrane protein SecF [Chloroflexota bacterium]
MFNLVERRRTYYVFSSFLIVLGIAAMVYSLASTGTLLQVSIDFTGGTLLSLQFTEKVDEQEVRDFVEAFGADEVIVQELQAIEQTDSDAPAYPDGSRWSVRTNELSAAEVTQLLDEISAEVAPLDREATSTSQVSASVGDEVTTASFRAILAATALILGFIYFAFRKVPHGYRYAICAIIAMIHDILIIVSAISVLGLVLGWEVDALFLTALLTVVAYSVQDTIVVFDRIRENLPKRREESYELIVNRSVLETIHRSFATQLNAVFVMIAIVLFGGETIRQFVLILLIGLTSGTYSSIFIAVPLLVSWSKGELPIIRGDVNE